MTRTRVADRCTIWDAGCGLMVFWEGVGGGGMRERQPRLARTGSRVPNIGSTSTSGGGLMVYGKFRGVVDATSLAVLEMGMSHIKDKSTAVMDRR